MFEGGLPGWLFSSPADRQGPLRRLPSPMPGVELWQVDLDSPVRSQALACLDADELQRAGRMRHERDRHRFLGGRVWLKHLLARSAGCSIDEVRLVPGLHGKPLMLQPDPAVTFSLGRGGHRALIAISRRVCVGVDIEPWRPIPDAALLADAHFDAQERADWAVTPAAERDRAFLRLWVRKEACLKAWGVGLGLDPAQVCVGLVTGIRRVEPPQPSLGGAVEVVNLTWQDTGGFEAALSMGAVRPDAAADASWL